MKLLSFLKSFSVGSQVKSPHPKELNTCVPLRQLINQVMTGLLPRNLQQKSFIVNAVENGMLVNNEKNILTNVIRRLLSTTIINTNDNCIHISANLSGATAWLNIKTNDTRHGHAISNSLQQVKLMTEKIGGCITVINNKVSGTTLSFTFRHENAA